MAIADIYVATNHIRDLLEDRLQAVQRAVNLKVPLGEIQHAMGGADRHPEEQS